MPPFFLRLLIGTSVIFLPGLAHDPLVFFELPRDFCCWPFHSSPQFRPASLFPQLVIFPVSSPAACLPFGVTLQFLRLPQTASPSLFSSTLASASSFVSLASGCYPFATISGHFNRSRSFRLLPVTTRFPLNLTTAKRTLTLFFSPTIFLLIAPFRCFLRNDQRLNSELPLLQPGRPKPPLAHAAIISPPLFFRGSPPARASIFGGSSFLLRP